MKKQFNLTQTIGEILSELLIKEQSYVLQMLSNEDTTLTIPKSYLKNDEMEKTINEDDRMGAEIHDVSGEYEVLENGEIGTITLMSNPYVVFSHYWGQTFFDDDKRYLIDMGIISKSLNPNDEGLGQYIKQFLQELESGEYE